MFDKIVYISNNMAHVKIKEGVPLATNIMNLHVIFEDDNRRVLGEVEDIDEKIIKIRFLGEFVGNRFIGGVISKPTLNSNIRVITNDEVKIIFGKDEPGNMVLGKSPLYDNLEVTANVNDLFSNHLATFGDTGSGKSWGVARLVQNIFNNPNCIPFRANIFIFDAYGEYHNAFQTIDRINPNYSFKFYTTNKRDGGLPLQIPLWLLTVDDMALLLGATSHSQLPIIEQMLKLVAIFSQSEGEANKYKNHLIAKAIMSILYSNQTSASKRNDIFSIIASCSTPEFNLESPVQGIGYTRKFRECFTIDTQGQFTESVLVTKYISDFIKPELDTYEPERANFFTMEDLEKALNFTLISEGLLRNEKMYSDAVTLKVRLHSLAIGEYARFFSYNQYITMENYIASLVSNNGRKSQIINFNLEDIEDSLAKTITKIFSRMLFEFTKRLPNIASIPFHIFLEEAHRYIQNDTDQYLIGYNIFDRIAKEGRKYGLMLDIISQRPVEISETVISQCSNFIIFKLSHPRDLDYIKKMLPNISSEIIEKQKSLQPGTCVAFGKAFKVPMIISMDPPNPAPISSNCDVINRWQGK